jgi:filamentous hemagglutinin
VAAPKPEPKPEPPVQPIQTVTVDPAKAVKGTPEFELLNNPPPNTRIELSNGNVYVTNAQGIVDEVIFQPHLTKGTRYGRQTAVGKQGLDTDVGGHIQGCAIGGTCDRVNLFSQDANFNNKEYKIFEKDIRKALEAELKGGPKVGAVKVIFKRSDPNNTRPYEIQVEYSIGGKLEVIPSKNQSGG